MFLLWKMTQTLKAGKLHSLRRVVIHSETGWIVQQHGTDLFDPEVLNSSTELGQGRQFRTVSVDSVVHDVLAVCLYGGTVYDDRRRNVEQAAHFV
jgi:hypothetical protein